MKHVSYTGLLSGSNEDRRRKEFLNVVKKRLSVMSEGTNSSSK
jgi:hypothetical protein